MAKALYGHLGNGHHEVAVLRQENARLRQEIGELRDRLDRAEAEITWVREASLEVDAAHQLARPEVVLN